MDEQIHESVSQGISEQEQPSQDYEVSLDESGDVKFSDEFFGDLPPDEPQESESEVPKYYTREELENTPYEQWDFERMNPEARMYADILNEQTMKRQNQQRVQEQIQSARPIMQEPQQYTAKELSSEASKLAMEKLGISDADEIDEFDSEYQAALKLSQDELLQKRQAELSDYNRRLAEIRSLERFNAELEMRPDFGEFNQWYMSKCREQGVTPEQVNAGLNEIIRRNGERYSQVQNYVASWYKEFQTEKAARAQAANRRTLRPPMLEGTRGGYDSGRGISMRNFSEMDSDGQARALMEMGIV